MKDLEALESAVLEQIQPAFKNLYFLRLKQLKASAARSLDLRISSVPDVIAEGCDHLKSKAN